MDSDKNIYTVITDTHNSLVSLRFVYMPKHGATTNQQAVINNKTLYNNDTENYLETKK